MLEKGRLYSLRKDGTKDSLYLSIKNKRFLFGSNENCTVRIYIDGIYPKHCVLTIGAKGKAYLKPLHPSALTLVNGIKIKNKIYLEDNDVVTIVMKEFKFFYPTNRLTRDRFLESLISLYPKQMKPAQKSKISTLGKNWEASNPLREFGFSNHHNIPKRHFCAVEGVSLKEIPGYLMDITHQEFVNILCMKNNVQEFNSSTEKSLVKYMNQSFKESLEERKNLALKLYEFIYFLTELLNSNDEYLYDLWQILESVWKYCADRASKDILYLPLKSLNLKEKLIIRKKSLQSRILSHAAENLPPVSDNTSEKASNCTNSLEVIVSSIYKMDEKKQNQYSNRKKSIAYKKRLSLAVKRYHLRKKKSIIMAKAAETKYVENLESSAERPQMDNVCKEINSNHQDAILILEKQQTTRTKKKRVNNKKERKELPEKEINSEMVEDLGGKLLIASEETKKPRRNKKVSAKTDLKPGKENIGGLTDSSSGNQVSISSLGEQKQSKEKPNSKRRGPKQEIEKESTEILEGEKTTNVQLVETKTTNKSSKRKKKEAIKNETALKEFELETNQACDSSMKCNTSENNSISVKGNNKKRKEVSQKKTVSDKSIQESGTQELSHCQRITRSMAKKRL